MWKCLHRIPVWAVTCKTRVNITGKLVGEMTAALHSLFGVAWNDDKKKQDNKESDPVIQYL